MRTFRDSQTRLDGARLDALEKKAREAEVEACWAEWVSGEPLPPLESLIGKHVRVHLMSAAERGRKLTDTPGQRVGYVGSPGCRESFVRWTGTVIAPPEGAHVRRRGVTGEAFIWVVQDGSMSAVGCYPSRLVRV